jgi:hypothetical protein
MVVHRLVNFGDFLSVALKLIAPPLEYSTHVVPGQALLCYDLFQLGFVTYISWVIKVDYPISVVREPQKTLVFRLVQAVLND